jgi:ATPase subunit of ABC transporter with duplicated ATPase domains
MKNPGLHKRGKAVETRIAHIEAARTQVYSPRERRLELADGEIEAKVALRIENLAVKTPDEARTLFKIERLAMAAGDRIALLGANGAGKSTLLTALAAAFDPTQRHYDGSAAIRFNPGCRLAWFEQTMADIPLDLSSLEWLTELDGLTEKEAVRALAQAGFAFARLREPISVLSSGERSRLTFLRMKLAAPNLYLLDEPTSHLDIEGQEALEAQLDETDVACLFVSHDRWFTRAAANRFFEIRAGRLADVESPEPFFAAQAAEP